MTMPPPSRSSTDEEGLRQSNEHPRTQHHEWLRGLVRFARSSSSSSSSISAIDRRLVDDVLSDRALILAPMVDASDLPFRLLCRRYGTDICYTPMIHAKMFTTMDGYRRKFWKNDRFRLDNLEPSSDRPLIVQFCGSDPEIMLAAAKIVQSDCDAVDINCGCPQNIAKRGHYGAYLLDHGDELVEVVRTMASGLEVPLCVKVRLLPGVGVEESIKLYEKMIDAGAALLTIHGRTRLQRGNDTGSCDWDAIAEVVRRLGHRVPIIANGGISNLDDVISCIKRTGAHGVMSSEAILEYPAAFNDTGTVATSGRRTGPGRLHLAREYLDLVKRFPPDEAGQGSGFKCVKSHLHRMLHHDLQTETSLRDALENCEEYDDFYGILNSVEKLHDQMGHAVKEEKLSWYMRHRVLEENGLSAMENKKIRERIGGGAAPDSDDETGRCMLSLFDDDDHDEW